MIYEILITVIVFAAIIAGYIHGVKKARDEGMLEALEILAESADKGDYVQIGGVSFRLLRVEKKCYDAEEGV